MLCPAVAAVRPRGPAGSAALPRRPPHRAFWSVGGDDKTELSPIQRQIQKEKQREAGGKADAAAARERQLGFVISNWRRRNPDQEPTPEELDSMSEMLGDMVEMYTIQNAGALPDDARVRRWFEIPDDADLSAETDVRARVRGSGQSGSSGDRAISRPHGRGRHSQRQYRC